MASKASGCGCLAIVVIIGGLVLIGLIYHFYGSPWKRKIPPPSGKPMKVVVFDAGQGDAILIISPTGQSMLIDAGDETKGQQVVDDLKREGLTDHLDYFVATEPHTDHIGGAQIVLNAFKVGVVLHNGQAPPEATAEEAQESGTSILVNKAMNNNGAKPVPSPTPGNSRGSKKQIVYPSVTAYNNFKTASAENGAKLEQVSLGQKIDLGGGAIITVLAPSEPYFTRQQMREGGNEPNANSIVMRLIYGEFSMLLPGDAETQTEERLLVKDQDRTSLTVKVLKVAHHGSKYATSDEFLKRVKPEVAIISDGEFNRYSHPAQAVLDRLKANGVTKLFRTDLNGDITITTDGKTFDVKPSKDAKTDVWTGREGTKDDSSRSGFISYGDYAPPPKRRK